MNLNQILLRNKGDVARASIRYSGAGKIMMMLELYFMQQMCVISKCTESPAPYERMTSVLSGTLYIFSL